VPPFVAHRYDSGDEGKSRGVRHAIVSEGIQSSSWLP
jgi:hypothetical protein